MKISLRQLEAFTAVAHAGSFSGAAQALGMTQPAFSQLVAQLEKEAGLILFRRTTRKVELTAAGQDMLPTVQRALRQFADVARHVENLHTGAHGTLTIGVISSVACSLLPLALAEFARQCPKIKVGLTEEPAELLVKCVLAGEVELGWGLPLENQPELEFEPLTSDPLVVIMHESHPLTELRRVTWRALRKHKLIAGSRKSGVRIFADSIVEHHEGIELNNTYQTASLSTAISLVRNNLGCAVFPKLGLQPLKLDQIVVRPLEQPTVVREIGLLSRKGWPQSPVTKLFEKIARSTSETFRAPQ